MTLKTDAQLKTDITTLLADNTTGAITEAVMRGVLTNAVDSKVSLFNIVFVDTYADAVTAATGTEQKLFFVKTSEINSDQQTCYSYDGNGGLFWIASVKVN